MASAALGPYLDDSGLAPRRRLALVRYRPDSAAIRRPLKVCGGRRCHGVGSPFGRPFPAIEKARATDPSLRHRAMQLVYTATARPILLSLGPLHDGLLGRGPADSLLP